ncbi:hypothetical protein JM18_008126 [Phytophthora kernoviae]|uniref:Cytochrome P450 n=1 Tax=Phytophthora kernoviae TaxID=325452 RepID=A0A921V4I6_9STRA|nr:hypothetical protein JM18_008126 [Phytophthora kernoviae]
MAYHAGRFLDWVTEVFLARDGAPFMLRLPFQRNLIFTANPEHYEHVMKTQYDNFLKGDHIYDLLVDLLGDGILTVDGEEWKFHRRVFVNLFSSRALREHMAPIIQKHVLVLQRVLTEATTTKQPVDFFTAAGRFTLDAFGEIAFGFDMDTLTLIEEHPFERAFVDAQHIVAARIAVPTWYWKLKRWMNLGTEKQLKDALLTVDKFNYIPTIQDVQGISYLEATINEALRLFSPVGLAQKLCVRDTVFSDGTFVPKGTNIALVYHAMARMPGVWGPDAASFVPERFIDSESGDLVRFSSGKFSAFNTGPRVCVGRNLAMMEMKLVVACVVSRYHLDEVPGQDVACSGGLTIGMKNPLMMNVQDISTAESVELNIGIAG